MFNRSNISWFRFGVIFLVVTICAYNAFATIDEDDPLFSTTDLEKELCTRFRLKPQEINALRPLIKLDNRNAALLYITASDTHGTDYMFLWQKVRRSHDAFAASINPALTARQRAALKLAHSEFETRILTLWMDDYVGLVAEALELDSVQISVLQVVFDVERGRRRRLLLKIETMQPAAFDSEWENLTSEREHELNKILSIEQMRGYRSLIDPPPALIA